MYTALPLSGYYPKGRLCPRIPNLMSIKAAILVYCFIVNVVIYAASVSRLEGFVSNREQSYEDPIEELLYAVFVVSSENATVAELAATLQADLPQLQAAASFACRLGWAQKLIDPASVLQESMHGSLNLSDDEDGSQASVGSANLSNDGNGSQQDHLGTENRPVSSHARVAFIVDANITSYLMMGSVSPGLKSHAVTLYEAGKLGHASIADLCKDLSTLEGAKFEGELQEFANHASSLRCVLECLLSGGVSETAGGPGGHGKTDMPAVHGDQSNSKEAETSVADELKSSVTDEGISAGDQVLSDSYKSRDLGADTTTSETGVSSAPNGDGSVDVESGNDLSSSTLSGSGDSEAEPNLQNNEKTISTAGLEAGRRAARRKNYRVDVLRCESLANLPPATLEHLFRRDYDIVLSMIPLPHSSILPGQTGPVHFGPPSHSSMTPWMKLVLYSAVGNGPLSVVLMKGQCLRLLPAPLAGCEKALIWSWDGSTVGGLGGKFEGNLVKGNILLHCLNSLLKHSAVLVQPLNKHDLDESGKIVTLDVPLPVKNSDGSLVHVSEELGVGLEGGSKLNSLLSDLADKIDLWTIGYIRLLRLFIETDSDHFAPDEEKYEWVPLSVEFGVPLFSPKLCKSMCKRVKSSQLLQTEFFAEHHEAMQGLRKRLHDICAEYNAAGPTAKLLYQKEKPKEEKPKETSRRLMTYAASGRWNPLIDPSSPISGASSEHQRQNLMSRQRSRREVLSFDGSILRSYALSSVYEAATRPMEEPLPMNSTKADSDEADSKEVVLPGVNLLFDGAELHAFDIGACLQARQPIWLIAEASSASSARAAK